MALTTSATDTEVRLPVNVVYQQQLLRNARPLAPYFLGTQPGSIAMNSGTATIKWRRFPTDIDPAATAGSRISPSVTSLSEITGNADYGQGRTPAQTGFTDVTATVAKYGQFLLITEEVDLLTPNGTMAGITNTLAISGGRSLNRLMRNVWEDNATLVYAGGAASDGAVVSKATRGGVRSIVQTLLSNSALPFTPMSSGDTLTGSTPMLPALWGIGHPHVMSDIAEMQGFKDVSTYAGHVATVPGEIGAVGDAGMTVRFVSTPEARAQADLGGTKGSTGLKGTSDVDLYTTVIYGQEAAGSVGLGQQHTDGIFRAGDALGALEMIAGQPRPSPADPFGEVTSLAWKAWFVGAILNANWVRGLRSGATDIST